MAVDIQYIRLTISKEMFKYFIMHLLSAPVPLADHLLQYQGDSVRLLGCSFVNPRFLFPDDRDALDPA